MAEVTDADLQRAAAALNYGPTEQVSPMDREYVEQIAAALAEERERGIDIGLQNATSIDHYEVGHCCRLCGETWPCDRAQTVGLQ